MPIAIAVSLMAAPPKQGQLDRTSCETLSSLGQTLSVRPFKNPGIRVVIGILGPQGDGGKRTRPLALGGNIVTA